MFESQLLKQSHGGRGCCSWGEISLHNVGGIQIMKSIGRWGWEMTIGCKQWGIV